jgi:uncharacterized protein YbjT (DUF2867 family)
VALWWRASRSSGSAAQLAASDALAAPRHAPAALLALTPARTAGEMDKKVLVLCATGKAGKGICQGLVQRGFEVHGTTRSAKSGSGVLEQLGVKPIVANYVVAADVERAIKHSGAKQLVFITDFFGAAKASVAKEEEQGKLIVDTIKASGVVAFTVFISVHDVEAMAKHRPKAHHVKPKAPVEAHLRASGLRYAILRPTAFFENLDDAANWNPLTQGKIKFLTAAPTLWVSTLDLGKAAAACFSDQAAWAGKTLDCASWRGALGDIAAALQAVSGVKTTGALAMPIFFRWLFLHDLDQMCRYFEAGYPDSTVSIDAFKQVVPDALGAQGWFRHHGKYANGTPIVKA